MTNRTPESVLQQIRQARHENELPGLDVLVPAFVQAMERLFDSQPGDIGPMANLYDALLMVHQLQALLRVAQLWIDPGSSPTAKAIYDQITAALEVKP